MTSNRENVFTTNAIEIAKREMQHINPELCTKFGELIGFISLYPESASTKKTARLLVQKNI
ncbi:hypothetical protein [Chimaeribacter californicus]|uniref:hypothetical protein n=1 Tax=Chimaeribacter californicus TaxID=2060067 RepID=UPI001F4E9EAF|nr:hypothetical protein [Chimaeribacter californicus]